MRKRDLTILWVAILAAIALTVSIFSRQVLETGAWGLSFRTEGAPPVGTAGSNQLAKYDAAYLGDASKKVIYLTFDAGYENGCTEKILDVLKKHNVPAAFFLVGHYMEKNGDLVRRMANEGHTVGNHTMHHPDRSKIADKEAFSKELLEFGLNKARELGYQAVLVEGNPRNYRSRGFR